MFDLVKGISEVITVHISTVGGYLCDAFIGRQKQVTGMANPDRIQIFLEAKTCHCLESSGEIGITHTTKPRHFI